MTTSSSRRWALAWTGWAIGWGWLLASAAAGAPAAEAWPRWEAHDPSSQVSVDHGTWTAFLERYVVSGADDIHRLAYASVAEDDRRRLDAYLDELQRTRVSGLRRVEQRAFWINLYNALTVQVVLDHHPVESIRDISISPGLFSRGPWGRKLVRVEGEPLSLDDVEHRILRPLWRDPRLHYALNCASIGCPNLAREAYTAANTDRLLEEGATAYVNHPRGASVRDGKLRASSIYDWFADDFGGEPGVLAHLRRYARPELRAQLARVERIASYAYDWSLNEAPALP